MFCGLIIQTEIERLGLLAPYNEETTLYGIVYEIIETQKHVCCICCMLSILKQMNIVYKSLQIIWKFFLTNM